MDKGIAHVGSSQSGTPASIVEELAELWDSGACLVETVTVGLAFGHQSEITAAKGPKPPEHIQVVQALPRDAAGKPRTEILQLVAMNQLDLIEPMMTSDADRAFLKSILESRKNLRDRFNFEAGDLNSQ